MTVQQLIDFLETLSHKDAEISFTVDLDRLFVTPIAKCYVSDPDIYIIETE